MIPRMKDILPLIHKRMGDMDLTQQGLSELLGLDQTGISRRLSGKTQFKVEELAVLLPYLGIDRRADVAVHALRFSRLAIIIQTLTPSSHKQVAMVLRAMADDLDSVSIE